LAAVALLLLLPAAAWAKGKVVEAPANPDVTPRVVGQGPGRVVDAEITGGVVSWVADPGPGLPRAIMVSNGTSASVAFQEVARGIGALGHLGGFPVPLSGLEVGAAPGIAAAIDALGVQVASIVQAVTAAYAVASAAQLSPPVLSAAKLVATGPASGLEVHPGGVTWTQGSTLFALPAGAEGARAVAGLPAAATPEGADVEGGSVVYAFSTKGRSSLVRVGLDGGAPKALMTSPGLLQGPVIANGWAVVRERRAFGADIVDRIVAVEMATRRQLTLLQRFDSRAGRVFLDPPRAEGNRIVVVQTYSRDPLGDLVLHPELATGASGLRSSVRVLTVPKAP